METILGTGIYFLELKRNVFIIPGYVSELSCEYGNLTPILFILVEKRPRFPSHKQENAGLRRY
jgi:hypothetical protein